MWFAVAHHLIGAIHRKALSRWLLFASLPESLHADIQILPLQTWSCHKTLQLDPFVVSFCYLFKGVELLTAVLG